MDDRRPRREREPRASSCGTRLAPLFSTFTRPEREPLPPSSSLQRALTLVADAPNTRGNPKWRMWWATTGWDILHDRPIQTCGDRYITRKRFRRPYKHQEVGFAHEEDICSLDGHLVARDVKAAGRVVRFYKLSPQHYHSLTPKPCSTTQQGQSSSLRLLSMYATCSCRTRSRLSTRTCRLFSKLSSINANYY